MRSLLTLIALAVMISAVGCCGPIGCGPGCGVYCNSCDNCEGGFGPPSIPYGPLDGLRQMRRSIVCGGGCGGVYYGEWCSSPPDCCDPCCDGEFVGGATKCTPFCWQPGTLISELYGKRMWVDCADATDCCECDSGCDTCSSCGDSVIEDDGAMFEQVPQRTTGSRSDCGCASCTRKRMNGGRVASNQMMNSAPLPDSRTMRSTHRANANGSTYTRTR